MRATSMGTIAAWMLVAACALLAACGAGEPAGAGGWAGTIDTLPAPAGSDRAHGAIVVHSPAAGVWDSTSAWRAVEELRLGTAQGTGPELFGSISGLEVDEYGRIYVLDRQAVELRVFGPDGRHIRTIGRDGDGPGEFRRPWALRWSPTGELWVVDVGARRYALFDTAGNYLRQYRREAGGYSWPWPGGFDREGHFYDLNLSAGREDFLIGFAVRDRMVRVDSLPRPQRVANYYELGDSRGAQMFLSVPFAPGLAWEFDPDGFIWAGVADRFSIVQRGFGGDTVRIIERDYDPIPVAEEEREAAIADLIEAAAPFSSQLELSRIPDVKPAFREIVVDPEGYLWIVREAADGTDALDVFGPEGRFLGTISTGLKFYMRFVKPLVRGDAIYAVTVDEFDVPYVVRLGIRRGLDLL